MKNVIKNKKGFTLVELLVVLVILAVLSAAVIPSMFGFIDEAKRKLCEVNRLMIIRGWNYQKVLNQSITLQEYFDSDDGYKRGAVCPSGGAYSVSGSTISCTIHGGSTGGGPSDTPGEEEGEKYPGTSATVVPGYWPKPEDFDKAGLQHWETIPIKAGALFKHTDGKYYAIFKDIGWISKDNCQVTCNNGTDGVVEATGKVMVQGESWTDTDGTKRYKVDGVDLPKWDPGIPGLKKGDMLVDEGGVTWICIVPGDRYVPSKNPSNWYRLP